MPLYEFKCEMCERVETVLCSFDQLKNKTPKCIKHGKMSRVFSVPNVVTGTSGQKELLAKKQEQRKTRSRAHFKNEVLPTIVDKDAKKHFEKKYKNTKKVDHTKL